MAISATLTLNNVQIVATTPSQFQLYFNLNVTSSTNVIKYKQYVDGVVHGVDQNIAPADQSTTYSTIHIHFMRMDLGFIYLKLKYLMLAERVFVLVLIIS